jgi:hypothetical protein
MTGQVLHPNGGEMVELILSPRRSGSTTGARG